MSLFGIKTPHRTQVSRKGKDRILIVSEGSKTEPLYFKSLRRQLRLSTAYLSVMPSKMGTAPIQVVRYGEKLLKNGNPYWGIEALSFDAVYAVFDCDDHASFYEALDVAKSLDQKIKNNNKEYVRFFAIDSVPCFELWLLLHFEAIVDPMHRYAVYDQLKKYLPYYDKADKNTFYKTKDYLPFAIENAKAIAKPELEQNHLGPFTRVYELVEKLMALKDK